MLRAIACLTMLLCGCAGQSAPDAGPDASYSATSPYDTLFIGNSYVFVNDVSGHYRALVDSIEPGTRIEQVAPGGYHLEEHAADARTDGTALATFLRTGSAQENAFDY